MILYVSESGGMVTKEYSGTPAEEAQNLAAAKIVANVWGCRIVLLKRITEAGIRSADVLIYQKGERHGEHWEIKTNVVGTKRSIGYSLRKANKQAKNVFLHITSNISREDLLDGIKGQIKYTNIQNIAIIKNNKIELLRRESILNMIE